MARKPTLLHRVAALALEVAARRLPDYSHPKSPHVYTQPQLMTCLVLRAYLKQTYRGVVELLEEGDGLRAVLGLADGRVPRHTTLEEFASRVASPRLVEELAAEVLATCQRRHGLRVEELAIDSTGMQASTASAHYVSRAGKDNCGHYVKLSLAVACTSIMLVSFVIDRGPCNDLTEARELVWHAASRCSPRAVYADAGYDAEWWHAFWRHGVGSCSYVPPVPRGGHGVIRSPWRSHLASFAGPPAGYGRRWHAESFHSGLKRSTGDKLAARGDAARFTEAALRLLAYQIRRA
jgi:hypothetical protein